LRSLLLPLHRPPAIKPHHIGWTIIRPHCVCRTLRYPSRQNRHRRTKTRKDNRPYLPALGAILTLPQSLDDSQQNVTTFSDP
jgi:hypothetical protein